MRVTAGVDVGCGEVQGLHGRLHAARVAVHDPQRACVDGGHLVVGEVYDAISAAGQRRGVTGHEVLAVADAHHERAAAAGGHQQVVVAPEQDSQAVGAAQPRHGLAHGGHAG